MDAGRLSLALVAGLVVGVAGLWQERQRIQTDVTADPHACSGCTPRFSSDAQKNSSAEAMTRLIRVYFSYRNIYDLNIYTCTLEDAMDLSRFLTDGRYKARIKPEFMEPTQLSDPTTGNFVDLTCVQNLKFFNYKSRSEAWLLWGWEGGAGGSLEVDSDVVLAGEDGHLWDVSEILEPAGTWEPPSPQLPRRKRRYDLGGRTLKGVFLDLDLKYDQEKRIEQIMDKNYFPHKEIDERYMYVLWDVLAYFYNFRIEIVLANTWGVLQKNGSYSGMIGKLDQNEADFGIVGCEMRDERFKPVNFVQPLQNLRFIFFFLEERVLGTYKALFTPFSIRVWLCVGGLMLVAGGIFSLMAQEEHTQGIIFVIGIMAQQGLAVNPKRLPLRVLSASLLILGLILYTYYNAAIMNGLLSPSPVTIHNVKDLKKSSFRLGVANVPYLNFAYNQQKYIPKEILPTIQSYPDWLIDVSLGLEKVRHERFSLTSDDVSLYPTAEGTFSDGEKCNIREVQTKRFPLAIALNKRSHYQEMFSQGVIRLIENGIAHRTKKVWYPEKPLCLGSTIFVHVSLEAVTIALLCWIFGVVFSTFILTTELVIGRLIQK